MNNTDRNLSTSNRKMNALSINTIPENPGSCIQKSCIQNLKLTYLTKISILVFHSNYLVHIQINYTMKKMFFVFAVGICLGAAAHAQIDMSSATKTANAATKTANSAAKTATTASAAGFNVNSLTKGIMGSLTPSLGLSSAQSPNVTNIVSGFLSKKAEILPLAKSNPTAYASKFGSLFGGMKSKLGTVLTAAQMTKFMGLKPKTNSATNVLSNLFF